MEISPFQVHLRGIFPNFLVWEIFLWKYLEQLNWEFKPFIFKDLFFVTLEYFVVRKDHETMKHDTENEIKWELAPLVNIYCKPIK